MKTILKNAKIITMKNEKDVFFGDVFIEDNRISKISNEITENADKIIDIKGKYLLPGFIQTHIHLCQTLFRGRADDLELLDWLMKKIWPFEGAHNYDSLYWSSMLGAAELIAGGTTTILDMGTVHHTDAVFEAVKDSGIRAFGGKVMMDFNEGVPDSLMENTNDSLEESFKLYEKWHNECNHRIKYAYAPRFAVSCTEELMIEVSKISNRERLIVHTHASENYGEVEIIKARTGKRNIEYFDYLGIANERLNVAHCIWLDENEFNIVKNNKINVLHCPSSNLKLGSGIADISKMLSEGISVSVGADGAPCSNNLDALQEAKLASLLQKGKNNDSTLIPAYKALELITVKGAAALGLEDEIGTIEVGKKADLIVINPVEAASFPNFEIDPYSRIIYSCNRNDIETVIIDGKIAYEDKNYKDIDIERIKKETDKEIKNLLRRV